MFRRIISAAVLVVSAVTPLACKPGPVVEAKGERPIAQRNNNPNADIGPPLFQPRPLQKLPANATIFDPILVSAHLTVIDKVDIPSRRDGQILFIGTEAKAGEPATNQHLDPYTGQMKQYKRLIPGDRVEAGALVVMLDDAEALAEFRIHEAAAVSADQAVKAAVATLAAATELRDTHESLFQQSK